MNLTENQVKEMNKKDCFYCGNHPNYFTRYKKNGSYKYNGIDRVDNTKGYIIDNVVPCCWECNTMKMSLSIDEFVDRITRVYKNFCIPYLQGLG